MKITGVLAIFSVFALSACATSSTTRLAQNTVRIDISAAPVCGSSGARELVNRMAAVETIRLGYDKYIITTMNAQNNVRIIGANYNTTGSINIFGNSGTYSGTTTATPIVAGSQNAAIVAIMFRSNDPKARNAIDARLSLGPDWQAIVAKGPPTTCLE